MIGGFRILDEIKVGSGGQGRVFKAICEKAPFSGIELGTVVALKVMPAYHKSAEAWARLEKRTGELVRLSHPNIVKYYGCFSEPGIFYDIHAIVQEWLEGETLKQRLARNPHGLDADEALHVTDSALAGLDYVAVNGIVHRDVKPSNIFLCLDADDAISCVKLIDFEVAHQKGDATTVSMTNGKIVGSFDYMAPDFTNPGFYGDERSDVFSMGVVMHETITGRTPCQRIEGKSGRADFAFLTRWDRLHEDGTNPIKISPRANRLLAHSGEVLAKALAPLPQDRYQTFAEFHEGFKTISYHEIKGGGNTYRFLQQIRCDDFCEVFKARILDTGRLVVVKSFSDGNDGRRLRHEGMILLKLKELLKSKDTSYFMECLDYFTISDKIDATELPWDSLKAFLVMEYLPGMPGNTLRDAIRAANGAQLPRRETFIAFARYAHALAILHKHGIVHRDIKPSNLYFPDGHPENAVLIGFTIACDVTRNQSAEGVVGTLAYMPPESVLTNNCGDSRRDIYALGLSLYEALTGKTAYPRLPQGPSALMELLMRGKNNVQPSFDSPLVVARPKLLALLKDMTNIDPELRIKDAVEVERRIGEIIKDDLLFLNESITLDGDSHTIDFLDEPFSVCPSYDDDMRGLGPLPEEELRELQEKARRLKRRNVKVSLLVGLLVTAACCTLFWWGRSNALGYRVLVDVLAVVWLFLLCTIDLKTKRLPNVLTLGGLALWLSLGFASEGATGLLACGRAAGIGFLFLLVPFLMKSVGGGLVKMMAACCAYIGWGRLLPFGVLYVVSGMIMGGSVWMDRFMNRVTDKKGTNIPGSPILAVATLAVIVFKWIGWVA